ncbi:TetR/AcrR family transcriptional regulator [Nitratidesulfovibrio liaohensis]|uniref:TetR/AcrR family transcriptional regulator n=1 Tax=Nitratidesulfovibrio liaohensis TaxID=2604158 RepID=UPI00141EDD1C|nr:TetR/AcrR family transcriptional regulator [Nitratidesulfovibrio liaohensis]NHZ45439.1 TetR/AcrR family transcriptional regulator [Nitratidesulfovibrio liaohensis]
MTMGRPPRDRRTEILEIAGPLFLEHGYQGTSMSRIAAALGGSKGTLYSYFSSKETLFEAYLQDKVQAEAWVFELPNHADDPGSVLTLLGKRFLALLADETSIALLRLFYHESPRFPEIGRIFYETCILKFRKMLEAYLAKAQSNKLLDIPCMATAADHFLALCQATFLMPLMLCIRREITEQESDVAVKYAVGAFLKAYGNGTATRHSV